MTPELAVGTQGIQKPLQVTPLPEQVLSGVAQTQWCMGVTREDLEVLGSCQAYSWYSRDHAVPGALEQATHLPSNQVNPNVKLSASCLSPPPSLLSPSLQVKVLKPYIFNSDKA